MESLLKFAGRNTSTHLIARTKGRRFRKLRLSALTSILLANMGVLATPVATIDISPTVARSALLSPVDSAKQINVILALPLGDSAGAAEFVRRVANPKDEFYRKYITPQEFARRFGANADDYAALKEWAVSNGLTIVHDSFAHTFLTVSGTARQLQTLFKTQLNNYRSPDGKEFFSAGVSPTIPDVIARKAGKVIGLTNSVQYAPLAKVYKKFGEEDTAPLIGTDTFGGTGPGGAYAASDLRTAYRIPAFGGAAPQTVAVFEQGGFFSYDVDAYLKRMKLPHPPVTFVGVNGFDGYVYDFGVELEAVLDIDMVIAINPQVKEVVAYEDGNDPFAVALLDALDQVAQDNKAQTLSISYGVDEAEQTSDQIAAENTALTQLAAQGITVLVSSGDNGAYGRTGTNYYPAQLEAPDPGSQPLVTSVGGTSLTTSEKEVYVTEQAWNRLGEGKGATGGGVSSYWQIPEWQPPNYSTYNGGSATYRNVPDVAAVGDPITGVAVYSRPNGGWIQIGGTSVAAPIWAGYLSVLNAGLQSIAGGQGLGFFNPTLYNVSWLYSVLDGSNGDVSDYVTPGYNAGALYNNCCGLGSLWGGGFGFNVLTANASGTPPDQISGLKVVPTKTSLKLSWTATPGATGYAVWMDQLGGGGTLFYTTLVAQTFVTNKTNFELTNLLPEHFYDVKVAAVNQGGSTITGTAIYTK
jgi:subtilase family serine protease